MPFPSPLACPVRGCARALERLDGRFACGLGHSFDVAREGYVNLLQPNERRSRAPGDTPEVAAARARLAARGVDRALTEEVARRVRAFPSAAPPALADVGCGSGALLARLHAGRALEAFGVDLSVAAVRRAARAHPGPTWIVANADRRLPFADAGLDLVLSIKGPKSARELARVLKPEGRLLLAVPAPDDLVELRRETAGGALPRDPIRHVREAFGRFRWLDETRVRERVTLERDALLDLLAAAYRGARRAEAARAAELDGLEVTLSTTLVELGPPEPAARAEGSGP